jgi:hypothetical protein
VDDLLKVAVRLEGLSRNCSVHAAGVVISPQPLKELVPLYKTNRDEIVTQFDMNGLDKLALLKMDFLGLTTLTLIQDALRLIQKRHGAALVPEAHRGLRIGWGDVWVRETPEGNPYAHPVGNLHPGRFQPRRVAGEFVTL